MPPFFPPTQRHLKPSPVPARHNDNGAPPSCTTRLNGPWHPSPICAGGFYKGGNCSLQTSEGTSDPSHPTLAAPKSFSARANKSPGQSFAPARIMTPARSSVGERLQFLQTTTAVTSGFVRPSNVLALFVRAGGSHRPRHSALALLRGASASRTTASIAISTAKSKNEADPQDPTIRQLTLC